MERYELLNVVAKPVDSIIEGMLDASKKLKIYEPVRRSIFKMIKKSMLKSFQRDHNVEVIDMEKLPDVGGGIIACNHQSWLDVQVLGSTCKRDLHFIAKSEFTEWPILSKLIELTESVYIKRGGDKEGLINIVEKIKEGWLVVIFPEGTIPGEEEISRKELEAETGLLQGHTGVVRLAILAKAPIYPVGISGTGQAFPPEMYPRLEMLPIKKKVPITIRYGEPIYFNEYDFDTIDKPTLRQLTNKVMKEISKLVDHSRCFIPIEVPMNKEPIKPIINLPKNEEKSEYGVLVLHGFTSHINCVSRIEECLVKYNIPYIFPILRGHGTVPHDLVGVKYEDWYEDAEKALLELKQHAEKIIVCGLSMGGLVSIDLGIKHPEIVSNVILIAPALKFADPLSILTPVLAKVVKYWDSPNSYNDEELRKKNNKNYPFFATDSFASLYKSAENIKKRLKSFDRPVLILQSKSDKVVSPESAKIIYRKIRSIDKKIEWFQRSGHEMLLDLEADAVLNAINEYIGSIVKKT